MNHDLMPEFRKKQMQDRIEGVRLRAEREVQGAYFDGFSDGRSHERHALVERLRAYEKDSVVAKLIVELLGKEEV